mmetsp:Transcript_44979/g.97707  ORF Transcript_44979/g.97707 Transcript_44979/m.97707 type:complete len:94 (+) Transcript_44979:146-427(+)
MRSLYVFTVAMMFTAVLSGTVPLFAFAALPEEVKETCTSSLEFCEVFPGDEELRAADGCEQVSKLPGQRVTPFLVAFLMGGLLSTGGLDIVFV